MKKDQVIFHQINKDKEIVSDESSLSVYTFKGHEDFLGDEDFPMLDLDDAEEAFVSADAHAIKTVVGIRTRYFVKRGKHGKLFNPIGLYSEGSQYKRERHAGKPAWEIRETTKKIFTYYIKFLRSKNVAWLHNAEREV